MKKKFPSFESSFWNAVFSIVTFNKVIVYVAMYRQASSVINTDICIKWPFFTWHALTGILTSKVAVMIRDIIGFGACLLGLYWVD